jgi:hypothetical protein
VPPEAVPRGAGMDACPSLPVIAASGSNRSFEGRRILSDFASLPAARLGRLER